jgi:hypothetical protein
MQRRMCHTQLSHVVRAEYLRAHMVPWVLSFIASTRLLPSVMIGNGLPTCSLLQ